MGASGAVRDPLYEELRAAERRDPDLREVFELLAGRETTITPSVRRVARKVNAARGARLRADFMAAALTSPQVAELLDVADHRAIEARRRRHTLMGWTVGNVTYHPDWQFTDTGTVDGLPQVIRALDEVTSSPLAADQIIRRPRSDLDGRSLADLLAAGQIELVVRLIHAAAA